MADDNSDFIPTADAILDDVRKQLDELTQEQRIVLHDSARVLVDGGAGTGKTLLAIEAAQRMARAGQPGRTSVLLLETRPTWECRARTPPSQTRYFIFR